MLSELFANYGAPYWGPLRVLSSITVLSILGTLLGSAIALLILPRVWHLGTQDKGRNHAHNAAASVGKPLGIGIFMMVIFCILVLVFVPWSPRFYMAALVILMASAIGFADDVKPGGFGEMTLGLSDLVISILAYTAIYFGQSVIIWMPFSSAEFEISFLTGLFIFTPMIWLSVNALNCNDGVDGLSATLSLITIATLGMIIYAVVGNIDNSKYLLIPFNPDTSVWVIGAAIMCGVIAGYLWHNAPPSAALMGDAGSRPIGLFIGMLIAVSGNPAVILFVAPVILANGATGLVKVGLIRVFKIHLFKNIRFPLHDHLRKNLGWSNSQVLIRFMLMHVATLALLILLLLKLR